MKRFRPLLFLLLLPAAAYAFSPLEKELYSDTAITASENGDAVCISETDALLAKDFSFVLNADHNSGTNPTLDVTIQEASSAAGPWYDVGDFAEVTTSDSDQRMRLTYNGLARCLRVKLVLGGTSPNYDVEVTAWFDK